MSIVTVIGCGMMGSAMSRPAVDNGHSVRLVGSPLDGEIVKSLKHNSFHPTLRRAMPPEAVQAYYCDELADALDGADLVLGGVSSFGVPWFIQSVLPQLKSGTRVLSITKGLYGESDGRLTPFPDLLATHRPDVTFMAVGGPCISFELFDRRQTVVYFCGHDLGMVEAARDLFATPYYHVVPTTEVTGVEGAVALKNAYAMGVSLAVGMAEAKKGIVGTAGMDGAAATPGEAGANLVYNPQAGLFGQSVLEIRRLVTLIGGDGDWAACLPGAGDLYVTVFGGRTRRLGTLLGRGMSFSQAREALCGVTLEAVGIVTVAAEAIRKLAAAGKADADDFPLLMCMDGIINRGDAVDIPWEKFGK